MRSRADLADEPTGVPSGRTVELGRRGRCLLREMAGPPDAPTALLLHGLVATGAVNWLPAFRPLSARFRVLAPDLRGHGRGPRSTQPFSLADCADDVAEMAERIGLDSCIVAGYSMGGPVAQLLWKRHRELVSGLVFAATSFEFVGTENIRLAGTALFGGVAQTTRWAEAVTRLPFRWARQAVLPTLAPTGGSIGRWGADELRRTDLRSVLEAISAIAAFDASDWVGQIDVPTAVVLTANDRAVHPLNQLRLARAVPGTSVHVVPGGHASCGHPLFARVLTEACGRVADRIEERSGATSGTFDPGGRVAAS